MPSTVECWCVVGCCTKRSSKGMNAGYFQKSWECAFCLALTTHLLSSQGQIEIDDQVEGLHYLASQYDFIDLDRVGIHGWSYGGYLSLMALMQRSDIFRVCSYIEYLFWWCRQNFSLNHVTSLRYSQHKDKWGHSALPVSFEIFSSWASSEENCFFRIPSIYSISNLASRLQLTFWCFSENRS